VARFARDLVPLDRFGARPEHDREQEELERFSSRVERSACRFGSEGDDLRRRRPAVAMRGPTTPRGIDFLTISVDLTMSSRGAK
jgi:hypothetical protein